MPGNHSSNKSRSVWGKKQKRKLDSSFLLFFVFTRTKGCATQKSKTTTDQEKLYNKHA